MHHNVLVRLETADLYGTILGFRIKEPVMYSSGSHCIPDNNWTWRTIHCVTLSCLSAPSPKARPADPALIMFLSQTPLVSLIGCRSLEGTTQTFYSPRLAFLFVLSLGATEKKTQGEAGGFSGPRKKVHFLIPQVTSCLRRLCTTTSRANNDRVGAIEPEHPLRSSDKIIHVIN